MTSVATPTPAPTAPTPTAPAAAAADATPARRPGRPAGSKNNPDGRSTTRLQEVTRGDRLFPGPEGNILTVGYLRSLVMTLRGNVDDATVVVLDHNADHNTLVKLG